MAIGAAAAGIAAKRQRLRRRVADPPLHRGPGRQIGDQASDAASRIIGGDRIAVALLIKDAVQSEHMQAHQPVNLDAQRGGIGGEGARRYRRRQAQYRDGRKSQSYHHAQSSQNRRPASRMARLPGCTRVSASANGSIAGRLRLRRGISMGTDASEEEEAMTIKRAAIPLAVAALLAA